MKITCRFYVSVYSPAGADVEERTISVDYDTDNEEHALELAERYWPEVCPANYVAGTLNFG